MTTYRMVRAALVLALVIVGAQGCELPEITVPSGGTIIVVQGLARPDRTQQWLLIEESFNGTSIPGVGGGPIPSPGSSATPVSGAIVTVSNRASRTLPCRTATFLEAAAPDRVIGGAYWAPVGCPTMAPGDTLDLTILARGQSLNASTVLPAVSRMTLSSGGNSLDLPGGDFVFNRDADTLQAAVENQSGRAIHVTIRKMHPDGTIGMDNRDDDDPTFWVDSNQIKLPGDMLNLFELEFEQGVETPELFVAGTTYRIAVAFMDRNFYDALRSGNSPLSGRGFINSIDGGYGFFGAMIVESNALRVVGAADDNREGRYRVTGVVDGVNVNLDMELYLGQACASPAGHCIRPANADGNLRFSAFTTGQWTLGAIAQSVIGVMDRQTISFFVQQNTGNIDPDGFPEVRTWVIEGLIPVSGPETMQVFQDGDPFAVGSILLERIP